MRSIRTLVVAALLLMPFALPAQAPGDGALPPLSFLGLPAGAPRCPNSDPEPAPPDPEKPKPTDPPPFGAKGLPLTRLMASSDGNGSMPVFDEAGRLVGLTIAKERDLFLKFADLLRRDVLPVETAARVFATNAADFYKLGRKGRVEAGRDADLVVLDRDFGLSEVFARGRRMVAGGRLAVRGTFSA